VGGKQTIDSLKDRKVKATKGEKSPVGRQTSGDGKELKEPQQTKGSTPPNNGGKKKTTAGAWESSGPGEGKVARKEARKTL